MKPLDSIRELLQPYEGLLDSNHKPRYLFRGQNRVFDTINSTFARIPEENASEIAQAYTVYCNAKKKSAKVCADTLLITLMALQFYNIMAGLAH